MFHLIIRDAGYGLHLLGRRVRERKCFSLEDAVRDLISRPADIYGIREHGVLAPSAWVNCVQVPDGNEYLDDSRPPGMVLTGYAA